MFLKNKTVSLVWMVITFSSIAYCLSCHQEGGKKLPFGDIQGRVGVTCLQPDPVALPMTIRMDLGFR